MKERSIIFNGDMVHAILDGRKTQTRRIAEFKLRENGYNLRFSGLRVGYYHNGMPSSGFVLRAADAGCWNDRTFPLHCPYGQISEQLWVRESKQIPRETSRILLEITDIRIERLQDISEQDVIAEGLMKISKDGQLFKFGISDMDGLPGGCDVGWKWREWEINPEIAYKKLWESIYGESSWDANPWVWVIDFRRIR
ncbi:hypothetical protein FE392_10865 [Xenorhabdus sp. 12]|uniref:Phage protein n=1 Tax=Xenorhabdus santafensis TaxID=2582833 RepID=A0ABU4SAK8_9GAMM|nr:hypothetical protein [Xenorhabdus sp. 12]MDX7987827.1 hypothetical protein [Xenorhabdus sp. 12]